MHIMYKGGRQINIRKRQADTETGSYIDRQKKQADIDTETETYRIRDIERKRQENYMTDR